MSIKDVVLQLPPNERLELAELLMQSLREVVQSEPPLTEDEQQEVHRRISTYMENPDSGMPWEAFKKRLG